MQPFTRENFIAMLKTTLGTPYLFGGINPFHGGADCLVADTLVTTDRGEISIDAIRPGDMVLTRQGFKPVTRQWLVREDAEIVEVALTTGRSLKGTADHRVFTQNRGWVPLAELHRTDILDRCLVPSRLSSTGVGSSATPTVRTATSASTSTTAETAISIGPSGRRRTDLSPRGTRSTTSTKTLTTTIRPTSRPCLGQIIDDSVRPGESFTITSAPSAGSHSGRTRHPSRLAGSAPHGANGTASTVSAMPSTGGRTRPERRDSSAPGVVGSSRAGQCQTLNVGSVPTLARRQVGIVGMPRSVGTAAVYDLTVDDAHEFYANGVLVHNCSGVIYWAALQFGVTVPRSTYAEWGDLPRYVGRDLKGMQPGDLIEFDVPSDGGVQPGHVGVALGGNTMISDPHTGAWVYISTIPNESDIWPIGYCRLPFVGDGNVPAPSAPTAPPTSAPSPAPTPPPQEVEIMTGVSAPVFTADGTEHRASIIYPGGLVHYWRVGGKWGKESVAKIADPTGPVGNIQFDLNQVPTLTVEASGELVVCAVRASDHIPFDFRQTAGSGGWGAEQLLV